MSEGWHRGSQGVTCKQIDENRAKPDGIADLAEARRSGGRRKRGKRISDMGKEAKHPVPR